METLCAVLAYFVVVAIGAGLGRLTAGSPADNCGCSKNNGGALVAVSFVVGLVLAYMIAGGLGVVVSIVATLTLVGWAVGKQPAARRATR